MTTSTPQLADPTKPGWYSARMKSWAIGESRALVKVTSGVGTADPLRVWQAGDERPWRVEDFEWYEGVYP